MAREGSGLSDAELLGRSRLDPDLFGQFYDRHSNAILSYCYRRTGCATTASDLVPYQETFASLRRPGTPLTAFRFLTVGHWAMASSPRLVSDAPDSPPTPRTFPDTALTVEVFAAAYAKRSAFRDTGTPTRAWRYGIARRQLGTFVRRQKVADRWRRRFGLAGFETSPDELERIEALIDLEPIRGALRQALGALPAPQQQALWLRVVDDRSYRDIATELGCTEGAARVRVSRGLTRLAEILEAP